MVARALARVRRSRPLGLLFLCLVFVLVLAAPAASQDDDTAEEPFAEAPPREWATLDVTVDAGDSLSADMGQQATLPITITNNGNIPAAGVVAVVEGGRMLAGTSIKVGDVKPGGSVAVALPIAILGRSAAPLPFSVRVSADNVAPPTTVPVERTFVGLSAGDYLEAAADADLLLEQTYDRYDGGFARPNRSCGSSRATRRPTRYRPST